MTLKKECGCCKEPITTKNALKVQRATMVDDGEELLWFTCSNCKSTSILRKVERPVWSDAMNGYVLITPHGVMKKVL